MTTRTRILIAVDNSKISQRAVQYVADRVGGQPGTQVALLHLQLPPRMLEWGGSEDPQVERQHAAERTAEYREMEQEAIAGGKELLQHFQNLLVAQGIEVVTRLVEFEEPLNPKTIASHILQTAREENYGIVVVGRHSFSGLQRLFKHHVAEELRQEAPELTLWVVE